VSRRDGLAPEAIVADIEEALIWAATKPTRREVSIRSWRSPGECPLTATVVVKVHEFLRHPLQPRAPDRTEGVSKQQRFESASQGQRIWIASNRPSLHFLWAKVRGPDLTSVP